MIASGSSFPLRSWSSRFKSTATFKLSGSICSKKRFIFVMCLSCILRLGGIGTRSPGGLDGLATLDFHEPLGSIRSSASKSTKSLPSTTLLGSTQIAAHLRVRRLRVLQSPAMSTKPAGWETLELAPHPILCSVFWRFEVWSYKIEPRRLQGDHLQRMPCKCCFSWVS